MGNKPNDVRVSMAQVFKAVEYANEHPDRYLSGTTNWCAAVAFALNRQIIDAQPADQQGEPVAWQWRRKTERAGSLWTLWTDCSEADYEACIASPQPSVRGIIREVRRLYAQPSTAKVDERAEFDRWTVSEGRFLGYTGWHRDFAVWQARAKLNTPQ